MTFKQMMMEKLKVNVACKVANNSALISDVAGVIIEELDYTDIAFKLRISSSDIADGLDCSDVLYDISEHLDMDEIRRVVVEKCEIDEIADRVVAMLPTDFMDDLATQAAREFIEESQ
jgi:hypothetical protein